MLTWEHLTDLQLDIVGIVAVLGEGSVTRNAQVSALGWHHILPRLLPAPQALLRHEQAKRLPTVPGTVVGAYSGNIKFELNHFCQLLHKDDLGKNEVQLVKVTHRKEPEPRPLRTRLKQYFLREPVEIADAGDMEVDEDEPPFFKQGEQAYGVKGIGTLSFLSLLSCLMSVGMIIGSVWCQDGFACIATVLLSSTSSLVGLASWWSLEFKEDEIKAKPQEERKKIIPDSDVVIYYPRQGAFRIVRCNEMIARLYFRTEICHSTFSGKPYRVLALTASVFLMFGLLCMGNSKLPMQLAFAASYILLNALYWCLSTMDPTGDRGHWSHRYHCDIIRVKSGPMTSASIVLPKRSDTAQSSSQNRPVMIGADSRMTTEQDEHLTSSPEGSPTTVFDRNGHVTRDSTSMRRRVTFREDVQLSALKHNETKPQLTVSNGTIHPKLIVNTTSGPHSHQTIQPLQKQNTKDLEGLKLRPIIPAGALKNDLNKWLGGYRLFHKQVDDKVKEPSFTAALWKAIALTGTSRWLHQTHIAPDNMVWRKWLSDAGQRVATIQRPDGKRIPAYTRNDDGSIQLPPWDYQLRLNELFAKAEDLEKRRPPKAPKLLDVVTEVRNNRDNKVKGITPSIEFKLRRRAATAKARVRDRHEQSRQQLLPIMSLNQRSRSSHQASVTGDEVQRGVWRTRSAL